MDGIKQIQFYIREKKNVVGVQLVILSAHDAQFP